MNAEKKYIVLNSYTTIFRSPKRSPLRIVTIYFFDVGIY